MDVINPPLWRRQRGRPKKLRKKQANEVKNPYIIRKKQNSLRCGKCHKFGHNSRSCSASMKVAGNGSGKTKTKAHDSGKKRSVAKTMSSSQPIFGSGSSSQLMTDTTSSSQPTKENTSSSQQIKGTGNNSQPEKKWHSSVIQSGERVRKSINISGSGLPPPSGSAIGLSRVWNVLVREVPKALGCLQGRR
ncbi:unnamed protein product [Ilex paraguariensis]|uniref:CCHC-type domain-containing protein n=1 Tax=Ilex paraguariensis TaxID=185542 RepID=A0ABC8RW27_9AQUA